MNKYIMASKVKTKRNFQNLMEEDHKNMTSTQRYLLNETAYFTVQHVNVMKQRKQLKLTIKQLILKILIQMKTDSKLISELDLIRNTIIKKEAQLKEVNAIFEELKKQDDNFMRIVIRREQNHEDLCLQFCRTFLYERKGLRDIESLFELNRIKYHIKKKRSIRNHLTKNIETEMLKMIKLKIEIENRSTEMEKQSNCVDYHNELYSHLVKRRHEYQIARNALQLNKDVAERNISHLKVELSELELEIRCLVHPDIISGIKSVHRVLDIFRKQKGSDRNIVKGYYGLVIENIFCDKDFHIAVENTAKDNLFYHIVETEQIGNKILKEIRKQELPGVFTFIPMKRLQKKFTRYPSHACYLLQNTIPLMTKLHFDSKFERVMEFIFGNMIICQNLDIASSFSRLTEFDFMVLEGDQLSDDSITGGYFSPNNSILEKYINRIKIMKEIYEREFEIVVLDQELENKDQQILEIVEEMQTSQNKLTEARISFDKLHSKIQVAKNKLINIQQTHKTNYKYVAQYDFDLEMMDLTKECLNTELKQDLYTELSLSEQCRMMNCYIIKKKLSYQNKEISDNRIKYELEKNKLENTLTYYLYRRVDDIKYKLENSCLKTLRKQLEIAKLDIEFNDKNAINLFNKVLEFINKIEEINCDINILNKTEPPAKKQKKC